MAKAPKQKSRKNTPKRKSQGAVRSVPKGDFAIPRAETSYPGPGEYPIEPDWHARLLASVSPGAGWERLADLLEDGRAQDAQREWVSEEGPRVLAVRVLNYLMAENRPELDAHRWKGPSEKLARLLGSLSRAGGVMYQSPTVEHARKLRSYCADVRACLGEKPPTKVQEATAVLQDNRVVIGDHAIVLGLQEKDVIGALAKLKSADLPTLKKASGYEYAATVLKRLTHKKQNALLKQFIVMPGKRGSGGYSTTITLPVE